MSAVFTYEVALAAIRHYRPFEGSDCEMYAIEAYEQGLRCDGERTYWTLEEAVADWRKEWETSTEASARALVGVSLDNIVVKFLLAGERE